MVTTGMVRREILRQREARDGTPACPSETPFVAATTEPTVTLTAKEAATLYAVLRNHPTPQVGYDEFMTALGKLFSAWTERETAALARSVRAKEAGCSML